MRGREVEKKPNGEIGITKLQLNMGSRNGFKHIPGPVVVPIR